jgi:hypothetical protein
MTITLKYVVKCEVFGLDESFQDTHFGHVFSTCQYATTIEKICKNLKFFFNKYAYSNL